jgi:dihydrolipoamide dehydrogenase
MTYDLVVIGGGSAGYSAAMTAASYKKKVCIIEKGPFGGLCVLKGCMPSKTLLWSARISELIKNADEFGIKIYGEIRFDVPHIINRKNKIIQGFADYRLKNVKKNKNIDLIMGTAKFISKNQVKVNGKEITGKNFLISTGSKAFAPPVPGLEETGYITSDDALDLKKLPESLAVLGGGPVTLELAYYFHNLGVKTTIIQRSNQVLSENDEDLARVVETSFREKDMKVYTGTDLKKFSKIGNKKKIEFLHKGSKKTLEVEEILAGFGRVPDYTNLDLESTEINLDDKGSPKLDDYLQTSLKNIYVAGDANNIMKVVNVAVEQGRVAAENMFGTKEKIDYHKFPMAVFSHPEVAWIGLTEKEAKEKKLKVDIGKLPYEDLGKAVCLDEEAGFIKFIVDKKTKKILGVSIVGHEASDIIHEAVPLLYNKNTLHDLAKMQHIHPTFGEIYSYLVEEML